ncbi:hypothetical protein B0H17DRAFT_1203099 [Mycena rosella]|uniref:Uncharacterized protein n=1 Tax=Mycena rosella TaxID=1033263 RepID=A0AAD7GCQ8_MYCRO|nr:hypothetical protein B0H17DRAFT_1203099 [Mycena rosella]
MSSSLDRIHPCFRGDPPPSSVQQPSLTAAVRYLHLERKIPSDYPYDIALTGGKQANTMGYNVPYHYITGLGPLPTDLTGSHIGDVYVDLTEGRFAAYGRIADGSWKRWYDPQPQGRTEGVLVKHPYFHPRMLWCSEVNGLSWFVKTTAARSQETAKNRGFVSSNLSKSEEVRWAEASVLIGMGLVSEEQNARAVAEAEIPRTRRLTSTLSPSPPVESRAPSLAPVLRKRQRQHADPSLAASAHSKKPSSGSRRRTRHWQPRTPPARAALKRTPTPGRCVLPSSSTRSSQARIFSYPSRISLIRRADGLKIQDLVVKNDLGAAGRDCLDLETELAAVEAQLALKEIQCETAQTVLERVVREDEEANEQFERLKGILQGP